MLSQDLADQIEKYINGVITLRELEEWLGPQLPSFLSVTDSDDADVIAEIELALSEINDGISSEDELRTRLSELLLKFTPITIGWFGMPPNMTYSGSNSLSQSTFSAFLAMYITPA